MTMHADHVAIAEEVGAKKTFVWAIDWPGWCRAGKSGLLAIEALIEHSPRYARVASVAGEPFGAFSARDLSTVDSVPGGSGTDFGVPSAITDADRRPVTGAEADRLARIVGATWTVFDEVAANAPAELRKGPRGVAAIATR